MERRFAIFCSGVFANGKGTPAYQVVTSIDDGETWSLEAHPLSNEVVRYLNDPLAEAPARERLRLWREALG